MAAKGKPSFENKICACTDEEAVQTALGLSFRAGDRYGGSYGAEDRAGDLV